MTLNKLKTEAEKKLKQLRTDLQNLEKGLPLENKPQKLLTEITDIEDE